MTIEVRVGEDTIRFPDGTPPDEIKRALDQKYGRKKDLIGEVGRSMMGYLGPLAGALHPGGQFARDPNRAGYSGPLDPAYQARRTDDFMRAMAQGATFNLSDEISALAGEMLGSGTYQELVAKERARDKAMAPGLSLAGNIAGGITTGAGLGRAGVTFMRGARPAPAPLLGRGAAEGAVYGAAYGAGAGETPRERVTGALKGGGLGAVTGAAGGYVAGKMMAPDTTKSIAKIKADAQAAYQRSEAAGVRIHEQGYDRMLRGVFIDAKAAGFDRGLHTKSARVLRRMMEDRGTQKSLAELDNIARLVRDVTMSPDKAERRMGYAILRSLDDYINNLTPADITTSADPLIAVSSLREAQKLWKTYAKSTIIMEMIDNAAAKAPRFSQAGAENALRQEFIRIQTKPHLMRKFSEEEQKLIRDVAEGGLTRRALHFIGKFAFRGAISGSANVGIGYMLGGPAGIPVAVATTEAARQTSTALTKNAAQRALNRVMSGEIKNVSAEDMEVLRMLIAGSMSAQE